VIYIDDGAFKKVQAVLAPDAMVSGDVPAAGQAGVGSHPSCRRREFFIDDEVCMEMSKGQYQISMSWMVFSPGQSMS